MDGSQEELNLEFNIIDNIIESAVGDLLLKDNNSVHYEYSAPLPLLLPLCRFCACENSQMMHISDVHQQIINDLRIPGIHETSVCTNICGSCNRFLEEFCKFRSVCEEGQKRLATLLSGRHVVSNYLKPEFTKRDLLPAQLNEPFDHNIRSELMLNSVEIVQTSAGYDASEAVRDAVNLDTTCKLSPSVEDTSPITLHIAVIEQPDISDQTNGEPEHSINQETGVESNHSSECGSELQETHESNHVHICEETNLSEYFENVENINNAQRFDAVIEEKSNDTIVNRKRSQKTEARRRVVDGRLEWVCLDCEQVFPSCLQLKKHRRNCELVGSKTSKRFATLGCDICGETMSTESALTMHKRKHETKVKRPPALKPLPSPNLEPIFCDVCGHASKSKRALRLHRITHSNDKQVECHVCGKRFKRRRTLRIHLEGHSGQKYECEVCGKQFLTTVTLRNHAKTHRNSDAMHECTVCQRPFAHPNQLQKHMMTHTGEYPYVCEICNAMFRTLGRYNRHMQRGHVLPESLNVIEQTETNSWDDLIEYQPESMLSDTLDETRSDVMLGMGESSSDTSLPDVLSNYASDHQPFDQAPGEFAVQRVEPIYAFIDCN
ncbi:AGAP004060-PA [Anopheles gambiae str. PEST]|uniref:AGAP004060-PA n=1 Tax=Anopheles gambiae TaxID=7165 RepID=Q7PFG3_ANOGA|nr:AGAP004060-PA [Anopheles gambiae str. PEST]